MDELSFLRYPAKTYYVYLSGIVSNCENYKEKFYNAEKIIKEKYGFDKVINPVSATVAALDFKELLVWEYCMSYDLMIMNRLQTDPTIFLRIDSIKDCKKYLSGAIIENYYAMKYNFTICNLVGNDIVLADKDIFDGGEL